MLLYLLHISLSSHFVLLSVFVVSFAQAACLSFLLFLVSVPNGLGWFSGLCRCLVKGTGACVPVGGGGSCLSGGQGRIQWCVLGFL